MNSNETVNPNKIARMAGFLYVLLIPLGVFGIMYIPGNLLVVGDEVATVSNIQENESLFRLSIVTALVVQLVNLLLVLYLYQLLKSVNKNYARLMVLFIVIAVPIAMFNELNNIAVLILLSSNNYLTVFMQEELHAMVMVFLDLHESGINIAGLFWGLWLFPMGYLVLKSGFIPKFIGILLMIACIGYLLDSFIYFINPDFVIKFSEFLFFGEIAISFWLLFKGVNVDKWKICALESA